MPDNRRFKGRADLGWLGGLIGGMAGGNELATDYTSDAGPTQTPTYRAKSPIVDAIFNRGRTSDFANTLNAQYGLEGYRSQLRASEGEAERQAREALLAKEIAAKQAEAIQAAKDKQAELELAHRLGIAAKAGVLNPDVLTNIDPEIARALMARAKSQASESEYLLGRQDELNPVAFQGAMAEKFKPVADVRAKMLTNIPEGGAVYDPAFPGSISNVGMRYEGPFVEEKQTGINPLTKVPITSKVRTGPKETPVYTPEQRQSIEEEIMRMWNASRISATPPAEAVNPQVAAEVGFTYTMLVNEIAMDTYNRPYAELTPQEQDTVDQLATLRSGSRNR